MFLKTGSRTTATGSLKALRQHRDLIFSIGALLAPTATAKWNSKGMNIVRLCWTVAGGLFVLFSAMNYFTHIGLLMNTSDSL